MAGLTPIISSFGSGEFTRRLDGRTDFQNYYSACRTARNFFITPHGGAGVRPGSRFIWPCKVHDHSPVLVPFDFNSTAGESYMLELGGGYARFMSRGAVVVDGATPYEVVVPWTWDEIRDVRYSQISDVMYLTHPNHLPQIFTRHGHIEWTVAPVPFVDGPYVKQTLEQKDISLTPSGRTGSVTVTATADLFAVGVGADPSTDIGRHMRFGYVKPDDAAAILWGWGKITAVTDERTATVAVEEALGQEHFEDPDFELGLTGWADKSTTPSAISHSATNKRLVLTRDAGGGYARAEAEVEVTPGVSLDLNLDLAVVNTRVNVYVGNATGSSNILGSQALTTTGTHSFSITPQDERIFVTIDGSSATAGDVDEINSASLVKSDLATNEWRLGAFCESEGYPETLCFFEERLTLAKGRHLFGSHPGRFEDHAFHTPLEDDDAFHAEMLSPKVTSTKWMQDVENLLVGTNAGEFKLTTGTEGERISPAKPLQPKRQSSHGSGSVPALQAGNATLYASPTRKKLRTLQYDAASYKYHSPEVSIFAEHLMAVPIVDLDYAPEPDGILWMAREDGVLLGATFLPEEKINAWHQHHLGGGGRVESVAVIPGDGRSEVWMVVRREIGGQVRRYIEMLEGAFDGEGQTDAMEAFHVDCGVSTEGTAITAATKANPVQLSAEAHGLSTGDAVIITSVCGMTQLNSQSFTVTVVDADTVTLGVDGSGYNAYTSGGLLYKKIQTINAGLDHLEGETVQVLADGAVHPDVTVTGGAITLDQPAGVVHVGYGYESRLQPMRLEVPSQTGTLQTKPKRITAVSARFLHTVGGQIGVGSDPAPGDWENIYPHGVPVGLGAPPQLFTGDYRVTPGAGFDTDAIVTVRQIYPLPMTVTALVPEIGDIVP